MSRINHGNINQGKSSHHDDHPEVETRIGSNFEKWGSGATSGNYSARMGTQHQVPPQPIPLMSLRFPCQPWEHSYRNNETQSHNENDHFQSSWTTSCIRGPCNSFNQPHPYIKFSDLTNIQQETICKYFPVVLKHFVVRPISYEELLKTPEYELKADIVKFIRTIEIIFGENPPEFTPSQYLQAREFIIEKSLASCRLYYWKPFCKYSFLTVTKLANTYTLAKEEVVLKIKQLALGFNITDREITALISTIFQQFASERLWIEEVNSLKKSNALNEIETGILDNLYAETHAELPFLFYENQLEFYECEIFQQKVSKLEHNAVKSFKEKIPFRDDELTKICQRFRENVLTKLNGLADINERNKQNARERMALEMDSSVSKYEKAISTVFSDAPMAKPCYIRIQHKTLQESHFPTAKNSISVVEKSRLKYLQTTDNIFKDLLCKHSKIANETLNRCYEEICEVAGQILKTHKVSVDFIEQIRKNLNDNLQKNIGQIKDSTIANPKIIERLASGDKSDSISAIFGVKPKDLEDKDCTIGKLLQVNIRRLNGQTICIKAYTMWTVKMLRKKFFEAVGTDRLSCTLYYKTTKLRDSYTLQSYNLRDCDFVIANM